MKLSNLLKKFHERYQIGATPAQRLTRKKNGLANAMLVLYLPPLEGEVFATGIGAKLAASLDASFGAASARRHDTTFAPRTMPIVAPEREARPIQTDDDADSGLDACAAAILSPKVGHPLASSDAAIKALEDVCDPQVSWLLLVTPGAGAAHEKECLHNVTDSSRLGWLGYELVRHAARGRARWTWRRPKLAMQELFAVLDDQLNRRQHAAVTATLQRIARQPGFSGIREQSWRLCAHARSRGYPGELPTLYFVEKTSPGRPIRI